MILGCVFGAAALLGAVDVPPHGCVKGIGKRVFEDAGEVLVYHALVHVVNHLLHKIRLECPALRCWTLEGQL